MLAEGNSVSLFNDPLLLNDRKTIWFLQSGSLALFTINVQNSNRVKQPLNQNQALLFAAGAVGKLLALLFIPLPNLKICAEYAILSMRSPVLHASAFDASRCEMNGGIKTVAQYSLIH